MTAFNLPDPGEGITEAKLVEWHVETGETVDEDDPVASVETDKAVVDIPIPESGEITSLAYEEGDTAIVGDELLTYEEPSSETADENKATNKQDTTPQREDEQPTPAAEAPPTDHSEQKTPQPEPTQQSQTGVKAMPRVKHRAKEQGIDLTTVQGTGPNGRILLNDLDDVDKQATDEPAAPTKPTPSNEQSPSQQPSQTGSDTTTDTDEETGEDHTEDETETTQTTPDEAAEQTLQQPNQTDNDELTSTPEEPDDQDDAPVVDHESFERFQPEHHEFNGPPSKRSNQPTTQQDQEPDQPRARATSTEEPGEDTSSDSDVAPPTPPEQNKVKALSSTRQQIASNMRESLDTTAQTTITDEADVTDLVNLHDHVKSSVDAPITYLSYFVKATSQTLKDHSRLNARFTDDGLTIHDNHDLGIAVDTDRGLFVPLLEAAETKSITTIAEDIKALADKTRDKDISPEQLQGSTFTISSIGSIGGQTFTPILNKPEVAILGIGEIKERPRYDEDGELYQANIVHLSLTIDHQVIDGADAARFLTSLRQRLNEPQAMLVNT